MSDGRVTIIRPGSPRGVTLMWWEWRDLASLARLYGWRGMPSTARLSIAEASELAAALERANVRGALRELSDRVIPIARLGGIDVVHGR